MNVIPPISAAKYPQARANLIGYIGTLIWGIEEGGMNKYCLAAAQKICTNQLSLLPQRRYAPLSSSGILYIRLLYPRAPGGGGGTQPGKGYQLWSDRWRAVAVTTRGG